MSAINCVKHRNIRSSFPQNASKVRTYIEVLNNYPMRTRIMGVIYNAVL